MIKKIVFSFVFLTTFSFQLLASEDRAMFWRVDSDTATVYLFGSIHFADESFYPLREEMEQAFESSSSLIVEIDASAPGFMDSYQKIIQQQGSYSGNETIKSHLTDKTHNELQLYLKKLGIPYEAIKKQKPGILVLTLAAVQAQQTGLKPELGLDAFFLAKSNNKKVIGLETMEQQLKIFLDIKDADILLQDTFNSIDTADQEMEALVSAWKQGDEKLLNKLLFEDIQKESPAIIALYERLYFQRNIKMTEALGTYLKQKGKYFVVVGAAHLIGEKGIVQSLQRAGYRVNRL